MIGRIYMIYADDTDSVYIGSTRRLLRHRMTEHKTKYRLFCLGRFGYTTSFELIARESAKITLLGEFNCNGLEDLYAHERYFINQYSTAVNTCSPSTHDIKVCPCGGHYTPRHKYRHNKTTRHVMYIKNTNST